MSQNQLAPVDVIRRELTAMQPQFKAALPSHVSPEKFVRVAMTALQTNPDLQRADKRTLFGSFTRAAQMGLLPDGREGAVVMFGQNAQFMPMIGGVLKLVRNSGELASLDALAVYASDKFTYRPGMDPVPLHEPDWFGDRGEVIGVYAVAKMKDGAAYVEIMNKQQVEKVRAVSRAGKSGPWVQWWEEMARKTVLRRLAKRLPMSTDLDDALMDEDESFAPAPVSAETVHQPAPPADEVKKPASRPSRLNRVVEQEPPPEAPAFDNDGVIDVQANPPAFDYPPEDNDSPI